MNIKIKWIKKMGVCGLDSSGSEQGPTAGLLKSDESSCGQFLDWEIVVQGLLHWVILPSQLPNQVK
jgi:hypothetical protein